MTIRLTTKEFEARLKESIRNGEPWIMATPLGMFAINSGPEPFYGQVDNSKFLFTNNSFLSPTGAVIEGSFGQAASGTTVDYQVKTMFFPYFVIRAFPILGVIVLNAIMLADSLPFTVNVILTAFFGLAFLYWRWKEKRGLKKLEKMFFEELDIKH